MNVLVLNSGSSSIKYRLIDTLSAQAHTSGVIEEVEDHPAALAEVVERLAHASADDAADGIDVVGHRVVHGGERFSSPVVIDDAVLTELAGLTSLAPLHNPANLSGIEAARRVWPHVDHVAVFDTAFHATMPPHAARYAVPEEWYVEHGVRRYGFHGTSHAFVAREAARHLDRPIADLDLITAHLGNGASTAAVAGGRSIDTSMGMSPLEGLVMGTRSGDVDPSLTVQMATATGRTAAEIVDDLNRASGLLGLCGDSDMRRIVARVEHGDDTARLALDVFCHRVKKYIGAHLATLGRCDALVFTGGIGEHSPEVRARICDGLGGLGFQLDIDGNERGDTFISATGSPIALLVVPTDEERSIAEQAVALLAGHDELV